MGLRGGKTPPGRGGLPPPPQWHTHLHPVSGQYCGPYSVFTIGLAEMLRAGRMPLVDGGGNPSNLTHVDDLVEAILAAIHCNGGAGERYFVTETRPVAWRKVFED